MPGSSAGGFAEGLWSSIDKQRAEARYEEDRRSAREGNILQTLAEHGTPDVQALALQGLIQSANPKQWKKGLGGFLGQYQPNPAVGQLHALLQTPETVTRQVPSPDIDARATPLQPQAGPPPMGNQNPEATAQPLQYAPTPPPMMTETSQRPRQALVTPEERYAQQSRGRAQGDVEGEIAGLTASGYTPQQARDLVQKKYERAYRGGAGGTRLMKGKVIPDPNSQTGFSEILLHPTTGQEIARSPAMDPTKAGGGRGSKIDLGDAFEIAARSEGFEDGASVINPSDVQRVMQVASQYKADSAEGVKLAQGVANANVPLNTGQQFEGYNKLGDDWKKSVAPTREMQRQYTLMQDGLRRYKADPIGGSQAVLVTFQKILDPESVVRESEYARSSSGLTLLARIQGMYDRYIGKWDPDHQKWVGGGAGVPEAELREMTETARQMVESVQSWNDGERARVGELATTYGLKPELVFGRESAGAPPPRPPGGGPPARPAGGGAPATATPAAASGASGRVGKTISDAEITRIAPLMVPPVPPRVLKQRYVTGGYTITP